MNKSGDKRILVLGVGNVLLHDEGVGIRTLNHLQARFDFPANVDLVDGGVLGLKLTGTLMQADEVIIIDAVRGGREPGTVYRFEWDAKPDHIQYKDSLHQLDLNETMAVLPLVGQRPRVVVIGVEYQDISAWGTELTPVVQAAMEKMIDAVLAELVELGAPACPKPEPEQVVDVLGSTG